MAQAAAPQVQAEERQVGTVKWAIWKTYATVLGPLLVLCVLSSYTCSTAMSVGSVFVLAEWSKHPKDSPWPYLNLYAALLCGSGGFVLVRQLLMRMASLRASRQLHDKALACVLASPMSWLDTNPVGRVVNRLAADLQKVDNDLQGIMQYLCMTVCLVLSSFITVLVVVPLVFLIVAPVAFSYYRVQVVYRASSRELQRLESIAKTPIYTDFNEALNGLATLRAYRRVDAFCTRNARNLERQLRVLMLLRGASNWLSFRLGFMGNLVVIGVAFYAVVQKGVLSAALAGLALRYSMQITESLNGLLNAFTTAEITLVAMERVAAYGQLPAEGAWTLPEDAAKEWPTRGEVQFENVSMAYREELELVLKGVSFTVPGGLSCGIVGRTGAGKSSLLVCLLRLAPLRAGRVLVDGQDLAHVGLHTLRHALALIPQDPVLFSGTVRYNLDPFGQFPEAQLWKLLDKVQLGDVIRQREQAIECAVQAGGENFSVGQRQLLCLARALLRSAKVLVLDEATASVDKDTDDVIQRTLAESRGERTLLCIAHRINTILGYDRVIVMKDGVVGEFGPTEKLATDPKSLFYTFVKAGA